MQCKTEEKENIYVLIPDGDCVVVRMMLEVKTRGGVHTVKILVGISVNYPDFLF